MPHNKHITRHPARPAAYAGTSSATTATPAPTASEDDFEECPTCHGDARRCGCEPPDEAEDDPESDDDDEDATPEDIADAEQYLAVVNLDELVADVIPVAFVEWRKVQAEGPDGEPETRYERSVRVAQIATFAATEAQLRAFRLYNHMSKLSKDERLRSMAECVLMVWQQTEPSMTLPRLLKGLDMPRISRLFQLFFNPTSRR